MTMPQADWADHVASLNSTLQAIEVRFGDGEVPREGLEAFKSSVDDFRLRIWGLLTAAPGDDGQAFQERFRIRRAKEICRGIATDLRIGQLSGRHSELPNLAQAATGLARSIEEARHRALQQDSDPAL
jgi:hypothetical protein